MWIERPPLFYRCCFPGALWRCPSRPGEQPVVSLTFDDGPIPEVTPWVLDVLRERGIQATFFCVGDNVRKYPDVFRQVLAEGHVVGNHTFHHLQGIRSLTGHYLSDAADADALIGSPFFRPPHGHMRIRQFFAMRKRYQIVMWDLVTRDYSRHLTPEMVLDNVVRYVRNGSIIVFHDSLKAERNLRYALPRALDYLLDQGYAFAPLPLPQR